MTKIAPGHYVHIISYETDAKVETLGPYVSERQAETAESGVIRNLSHDYYTMTEEVVR